MERRNEIQHDIEIQIDPVQTLIKKELDSLPVLSPSRCIYRVPDGLREVNEKAYTPQIVSIGPLHHGKEHLVRMEEHKLRYLQVFLHRNEVKLETCIKRVRDQEVKLRNCYAEQIKFTSDEFVRLVLVDAVFIIELLLRRNSKELQRENDDYIFGKPGMTSDIWTDLLMLENQLPFFILEDLFEGVVRSNYSILILSYACFSGEIYSPGAEPNLETLERLCSSRLEVKHFVDVTRNLCLPVEPKTRGKLNYIPSMTELHQAGVKFKVRSTLSLLDIHFADGILEIPKLQITGSTKATIRNLVAYEQCHYDEAHISDYVTLIDGLVNTPKDVELLVEYGIVLNILGDNNEASTLINNLAKGVITDFDHFYFATVCDDLYAFCGTSWHKWKANLRQNYLNTPWAVISVAAAIFLLVLTLIQTVCSMYPLLKHQPNSK